MLALAVQGAVDGFWYWNFKTGTGWFSDQWFALMGIERSEPVPTVLEWRLLAHEEDVPNIDKALQAHLEHRRPYGVDFRCRIGRAADSGKGAVYRWLRARGQAQWDADGSPVRMAGSVIDIDQLKQSEKTSLESAARFRALWESTGDGILIVEPGNSIVYSNQAAARMLGFEAAQLQGQDMSVIQPERLRHGHRQGMQRYIATGERQLDWRAAETFALHRDGREIPVELSFTELNNGTERSFVAFIRDITRRRQAEERIQFLALHDPLTGLPNRAALERATAKHIGQTAARDSKAALMYIDLDRFKDVNDWLGHSVGDQLLQQVAERFRMIVPEDALIARQGGDEFIVLLLDRLGDSEHADNIAQALLICLQAPFEIGGNLLHVGASIGISLYPSDGDTAELLLARADAALYGAKDAGRNRLRFYSAELDADAQRRVRLEQELRMALERQQLSLVFQPVYDVAQESLISCEALLRWKHPELGEVSPADFIPVAEASGLIVPIGNWVLGKAMRQLSRWRTKRWPELRMSVNLSARQLFTSSLVETVVETLAASCLPPQALILELTESALVENPQEAAVILFKLFNYGVALSIDDFGTGFSSLSYLKRYPFSELKIDRSFIKDIHTDPNDAAIVKAVIAMSRSLGLNVIAEGVETIEQANYLSNHGCQKLQGYLLGRPMDVKTFEETVER
jgi:diguanylate cyclase